MATITIMAILTTMLARFIPMDTITITIMVIPKVTIALVRRA